MPITVMAIGHELPRCGERLEWSTLEHGRIVRDIVEEVVVGKFKGETFAESFPRVGDGSPRAFLYMIIIFAIALIPFFSFKEIGRVFGERELRSLFFTPAKRS